MSKQKNISVLNCEPALCRAIKSPGCSCSKEVLKTILKKISKVKILVVGDLMLDEYIWGKVTRISPEAPVPVVNVNRETMAPGGAANVAHNIYSLRAGVSLAGIVGDDFWGNKLIGLLKQNKVNTQAIVQNKRNKTITKTRVIAQNQQVARIDREKNSTPTSEDLKQVRGNIHKIIKTVDAVIIEDYGKGLIDQELVYCLVKICRENNIPLVVDPKKGHMLDYSGVTSMTPNMEEAMSIFGQEYTGEYGKADVKDIGAKIIEKYKLPGLLITLSENGLAIFEGDKPPFFIPTMAREVYDVSGAGDTVVGVFAAGLATGAGMRESAVLANIAAGIVVGKLGTAVVTVDELIAEIDTNNFV